MKSPISLVFTIVYTETILGGMDYIGFIEEHFTPTVREDKLGMKVVLTHNSEVVPECVVWFERAKKGWSRKPIKVKNTYIIVDADLLPLIDFMHKYMGLKEDHYKDLRMSLIHYTMGIIDKHLMGE
jgi:hypothetical protein